MIIKKFEHIFGIRKLTPSDLIDGNTLIYSPNGTMKTSFCQGLDAIIGGEDPSDVEHPGTSNYELQFLTQTITQADKKPSNLPILCISGEEGWEWSHNVTAQGFSLNPESINAIAKLAISPDLKSKFASLQHRIDILNSFVTENLRKEKTSRQKDQTIFGNYELDPLSAWKFLLKIQDSDITDAIFLKDVDASDGAKLTSKKPLSVISTSDFSASITDYVKTVHDFGKTSIFNGLFDPESLAVLVGQAEEAHFFEAGHSFFFQGDKAPSNKAEIQKRIEEGRKQMYANPKIQAAYRKITDLTSTKDCADIKSFIDHHQEALPTLKNTQSFKNAFFVHAVNDNDKLKAQIEEANLLETELEEFIKLAAVGTTEWAEVAKTFNERFVADGFVLKIENVGLASIGQALPMVSLYKKDGTVLSASLTKRLSTGEKHTLWILNTMLKIRTAPVPESGEPLVIVMDDIADSFDFNNKYGIVEYVADLLTNDHKYQIIFLTHSFDFFKFIENNSKLRSKSSPYINSVTKEGLRCLFAYKTNYDQVGNDVVLEPFDSRILKDITSFNNWQKQTDQKFAFASLPYLRNLEQIIRGSDDPFITNSVDHLMHYFAGQYKIQDLLDTYQNASTLDHTKCLFLCSLVPSQTCFDFLRQQVAKVTTSSPLRLEDKIVLGLFIRYCGEKMCFDSIIAHEPSNTAAQTWYGRPLLNYCKSHSYLTSSQEQLADKAFMVSPTYAHANSFIESPLIDNGPEYLLNLAQNLITTNKI